MNSVANFFHANNSKKCKVNSLEMKKTPLGSLTLSYETPEVHLHQDDRDVTEIMVEKLLSVGEHCGEATDAVHINVVLNKIAVDTRRGAGNVLIYHFDDAEQILNNIANIRQMLQMLNIDCTPVRVEALRGKIILRYRSSMPGVDPNIDGTPIMALYETTSGTRMVPGSLVPERGVRVRYVGFHDHNSEGFVKIMDIP